MMQHDGWGAPQLSWQLTGPHPVGVQHIWFTQSSVVPGHPPQFVVPQPFVTVVMHALPQLGIGQMHWLLTHVSLAVQLLGHPTVMPHAVTEPQATPAQLGGVQHAPWKQGALVGQPGQVMFCPQLFVNGPPQASVVWQALLSGRQQVDASVQKSCVLMHLPLLPQ
jgi:hypothetical protein